MATSLDDDFDLIADADTNTDWTLGDVDTDMKVQGVACLGEQVKATTSQIFTYTLPVALDFSTGGQIFQWFSVAGEIETFANGGFMVYLESSLGNNALYNAGGSDVNKEKWSCAVVDPQSTPAIPSGTLDLTNITKYGVRFTTITSIAGTVKVY